MNLSHKLSYYAVRKDVMSQNVQLM